MIAYVNGEFLPENQAFVSIRERAFLYGDGVFTNLLVHEGKIFFLKDHFKRLKEHGSALGISSQMISPDIIKKLLMANDASKGSWLLRIIVTAGMSEEGTLHPRSGGIYMLLQKKTQKPKEEIKLSIYPEPISYPLAKLKPISYMNRFWIKEYAKEHKSDDSLVKDPKGNILEASTANVFWIHKNFLFYPSEDLPFLFGITLKYLLEAAKNLGFTPKPGHYKEDHLFDSNVYLSSAAFGFSPVTYLKDHKLERDPTQENRLRKAFDEIALKDQFSCL